MRKTYPKILIEHLHFLSWTTTKHTLHIPHHIGQTPLQPKSQSQTTCARNYQQTLNFNTSQNRLIAKS